MMRDLRKAIGIRPLSCWLWLSLLAAGCGSAPTMQQDPATSAKPVATLAGPPLRGRAHGGRQPITGAQIQLYAAGTTGYASASTALLTSPVFTDGQGLFDLNGKYNCTPGQQLYIVATGGNTGSGVNANAALLAAVGECSTVTASTNIEMNEATTVGSVFALAPFMTGKASLGAPPENAAGLAGGFRSVNKLVNMADGSSIGSALPVGAIAPSATVNTLSDIFAACVNSRGGVAGDGSICGNVFALAPDAAGIAPTDTVGAALNIARHPTGNVQGLFALVPWDSPFLPNLHTAPADWTLSVTYTGGALHQPSSAAVDGAGNLWIASAGNSTLSALTQEGTPLPGSPFNGNGLSGPAAIGVDASGHVWVANKAGTTVSAFTATGQPWGASPFNVGASPAALAIDNTGNIWVANSGSGIINELSGTGVLQQSIHTQGSAPTALAIH